MKTQFFFLGFAAVAAISACNDSNTNGTGGSADSSKTTTTTTTSTHGRMIPNFGSRSFVDLKTGKPVQLVWDTVHFYYIDQTTNQEPGFYYDPSAHDTFDYRGRVLNNALSFSNGDYSIDETRVPSDDVMMTTDSSSMTNSTTIPDTTTTMANGKMKTKIKDDKVKIKSK